MEKVYANIEMCDLCDLLFDLALQARKDGMTKEELVEIVSYLCTLFGIETERVCNGAVNQFSDVILYIMDNYDGIKSERLCGSLLQNYDCPTGDEFEWSINIPTGNAKERPQLNTSSESSLKILHLSDIHYDPKYTPNANADCGEPVCCQDDQGEASSPETACGYWSDYRLADSPWYLVEETIRQTKTQVIIFNIMMKNFF